MYSSDTVQLIIQKEPEIQHGHDTSTFPVGSIVQLDCIVDESYNRQAIGWMTAENAFQKHKFKDLGILGDRYNMTVDFYGKKAALCYVQTPEGRKESYHEVITAAEPEVKRETVHRIMEDLQIEYITVGERLNMTCL